MPKKPKIEEELDEEEANHLDAIHAAFMEEISEILGQAYNENEGKTRALIDELDGMSK